MLPLKIRRQYFAGISSLTARPTRLAAMKKCFEEYPLAALGARGRRYTPAFHASPTRFNSFRSRGSERTCS